MKRGLLVGIRLDGRPGPCSVVSYCPWMYGDVEGWAAGDEKGWWRRRERVRWGGG